MSPSENTLSQIACTVACVNANGEPELYYCVIQCTPEQYALGEHYLKAAKSAEAAGYEAKLTWDVSDPASGSAPDWSSVPSFDISSAQ